MGLSSGDATQPSVTALLQSISLFVPQEFNAQLSLPTRQVRILPVRGFAGLRFVSIQSDTDQHHSGEPARDGGSKLAHSGNSDKYANSQFYSFLTNTSVAQTGDSFDVYNRIAYRTHGDLVLVEKSQLGAVSRFA